MKRAPIRDIVVLFLVTRLLLMLVTYFGYVLLTAAQYSSAPVDAAFFSSWNHGDVTHYLSIAHYGYQSLSDTAFFPLFPLLVAAIAHLLGDWSYLFVGMFISNAALLGTLFILYQLAVDSVGEEVANRTLLYWCIFPTAFFFFAAYNESLFLLLTTGTFLALRRQRWWLAGLLGCGAALTRPIGILLIVPYLYELWIARESILVTRYKPWLADLPVLLILIGTLLYCLYCWKLTGNPLTFVVAQSHAGRQLAWPWQGLWQALVELFWQQPFGSFYQVHTLLDFSAILGFILLTLSGWSRLRISYSLWNILLLLCMLLYPTLSQQDPLAANQRLVLELFPAFFTLALSGARHPRLHQALQIGGIVLQATLSLLFVMNRL
jgi:Gpi18-like mannosyltransferase